MCGWYAGKTLRDKSAGAPQIHKADFSDGLLIVTSGTIVPPDRRRTADASVAACEVGGPKLKTSSRDILSHLCQGRSMEASEGVFSSPHEAATAAPVAIITEADAAHDAAIEESVARGAERRKSKRRPYVATHLVAFHAEGQNPAQNMFQAVRCREISTSGVSFLCEGPPPFDYCTLMLGRHPRQIRVKAWVVHCLPFAGPDEQWIIGCNFLDKQGGDAWTATGG